MSKNEFIQTQEFIEELFRKKFANEFIDTTSHPILVDASCLSPYYKVKKGDYAWLWITNRDVVYFLYKGKIDFLIGPINGTEIKSCYITKDNVVYQIVINDDNMFVKVIKGVCLYDIGTFCLNGNPLKLEDLIGIPIVAKASYNSSTKLWSVKSSGVILLTLSTDMIKEYITEKSNKVLVELFEINTDNQYSWKIISNYDNNSPSIH